MLPQYGIQHLLMKKSAFHIILGEGYSSYSSALNLTYLKEDVNFKFAKKILANLAMWLYPIYLYVVRNSDVLFCNY